MTSLAPRRKLGQNPPFMDERLAAWTEPAMSPELQASRAICELKGPASVRRLCDEINWDYAVVERLNREDLSTTLIPFNLGKVVLEGDAAHNLPLRAGDLVTVFRKV